MSEDNMWKILAEPWVMIGSDASVRAPTGPLGQDHPHPRAYGAFPRFLRAALDGKTVGLPEAVRKMTSLPAAQFRLKDRGILAAGMRADVVVFDPARVHDASTFVKPHQLAEGIETVVVNGVVTVQDARLTGKRAGLFLG
jgi:N-acyl-D-amino-acid deacylase